MWWCGIVSENRFILAGYIFFLIVLLYTISLTGTIRDRVSITIGRVSYVVSNFLVDSRGMFLSILPFLLFIITLLAYGPLKFYLTISLLHLLISILSIYVNPILLVVPIASTMVSVSIRAKETGNSASFINGIVYAFTSLEILVLIQYLLLLAGYKPVFNNIINLEMLIWSNLWFVLLGVIPLLFIMSMYKSIKLRREKIEHHDNTDRRYSKYIYLAVMLSIFVSTIGYLPSVNPYKYPLNVDWLFYYEVLQRISVANDPIIEAFMAWPTYGDRPLYILILFAVHRLFGIDLKTLCIYHNIPLLILYTLSTYFMVKRLAGVNTAIYAALIAPVTPNAISFIYGGFQANLFTLSLTQIALGFILKPKPIEIPLVALLSATALLSHMWTWLHFALLIILHTLCYIAVLAYRRYRKKSYNRFNLYSCIAMVTFVVVGVAIHLVTRLFVYGIKLAEIEALLNQIYVKFYSLQFNIVDFVNNVEFYHTIYTGGSLNNPLYWIISLFSIVPISIEVAVYMFASMFFTLVLYTVEPLYGYRVELNTPVVLVLLSTLTSLRKSERVLVLISLYSIGLGKILSFIPGLPIV